MKIYFLSSQPCALTLNGVFYGITDTFERSAEICLADKIYAKFSPENALPVGFFITEALPASPPVGCEVYILRDGIAVYACDFPPADCALRPIAQAREGACLATVFSQGKTQLTVESPSGFFNATIPSLFDPCEVFFHDELILLKGKETLGVYTKSCGQVLVERVLDYSLSESALTATLPLSDSLQRTAKCVWELTDGECKQIEFTLSQPTKTGAPPEGLLAYAFFESVLLKADYTAFLCERLQPDAEEIRAFLGEFVAVTLTHEPTVCGLVRKKGERLFAVDYFSVEIENGKIADVKG